MSRKLKKTLALVLSLVTVLSAAFTSMADVEVVEEIEKDQVAIPEAPASVIADVLADAAIPDTEVDSVLEVEEVVEGDSVGAEETSAEETGEKLLGGGSESTFKAVYNKTDGILTFYYDGSSPSSSDNIIVYDHLPTAAVSGDNWPYNGIRDQIKKVVIDPSVKNLDGLTSTNNMFSGFKNMDSIEGLEYLDTSNVTTMHEMFLSCAGLPKLDLSGFNTSNVTDMHSMFSGIGLSELNFDGFRGFDTSKVADMASMFQNCKNLKTLNISNFNTSSVTDMSCMFSGVGLSELDLSGFDTSKVTNMESMFYGCKNLATLNISNFDTFNVTNMREMFREAGLSGISFGDGFKTGNVTDMQQMFSGSNIKELSLEGFDFGKVTTMHSLCCDCPSLESVTISSKVNTDSLTTIHQAFSGCSKLKTVTLGEGFTFNNVFFDPVWEQLTGCDMGYLFLGSGNLETVKVSESFVISEKCICNGMFENCSQLTGEKGTKASDYDFSGKEREFAHIDEGPANPGFFSALKKTLSSITVTSGPTRTSYTEGETFDPAGIVITATYGDGTTAPVTGYTFAPSGTLKASDTTVTISYTEGDVTKSATVTITVSRKSDPKPVPTHDDDDREPLFTGTWNNPVKSGAWSQDSHGIWHYTSSEIFRNTWAYIYNPYAHDGQHTSDWFWFDRQGNMLTGWQFINGKWYYLHTEKDGVLGSCLIGPAVTPDGWTVDESGAWVESIPRK